MCGTKFKGKKDTTTKKNKKVLSVVICLFYFDIPCFYV